MSASRKKNRVHDPARRVAGEPTASRASDGGRADLVAAGADDVKGTRGPAGPADAAAVDSGPRDGSSAVIALWSVLVVLLFARLVLTFVPDMRFWGLNLQRFLPPALAWTGWALMAVALIPMAGRRAERVMSVLGDGIARHGKLAFAIAGIAGATLVFVFPDQVHFVGDFLLRQGTVEEALSSATLFPQALPLDVVLHNRLPFWAGQVGLADANTAARWLGALEAGLLAALAVGFARVLALRGAAATAAAAVVFFGGYLGMFTGYSKAFAELVVLFAAVGVFGLRAVRGAAVARDRGARPTPDRGAITALFGLGVAVALALTLHRSAPAILPAFLLVWIFWLRTHGARAFRHAGVWLAAAIPLVTLAVMVSQIVHTVLTIDRVHFAPAEVEAAGGPLRAALAGTRGFDLVNLVLLLSPLALAVPVLAATLGRASRDRQVGLLLVLALPLVIASPFMHPVGGMHRDWDDFTFCAATLSLLAAWYVARVLGGSGTTRRSVPAGGDGGRGHGASTRPGRPSHAWLAAGVALAVAVPAIEWIALHSNFDAGLARVQALVDEPPRRADSELARTYDYLGTISFQHERWDLAAHAFQEGARIAPSPRMLQQWALAETRRGDFRTAQRAYWQLLEKDSTNAPGWLGLAAVSSRFGDIVESRRAALRTLQVQPGQKTAIAMLQYLDNLPPALRDSLERLYPPRSH
jgi:hypothetical protein